MNNKKFKGVPALLWKLIDGKHPSLAKLKSKISRRKAKEITFGELAQAISYVNYVTKNTRGIDSDYDGYRCNDKKIQQATFTRSKDKPNTVSWDYNSYIKSLQMWIEDMGLETHITLKINTEPQVIEEMDAPFLQRKHFTYFTRYTIIIHDLIINCGLKFVNFVMDPMTFYVYPFPENMQYSGGLHIVFQNNEFKSENYPKSNDYIHCWVGGYSFLEFKNNNFENVDLYVSTNNQGNSSILIMENNKLDNYHTSIALTSSGLAYNLGGWVLPASAGERAKAKKRFEKRINDDLKVETETDKVEINPKDIRPPKSNSLAKFKNNQFNKLNIHGDSRIFFKGNNKIDMLECKVGYVHFDSPQCVDPKGRSAFHHGELFSELADQAIDRKDATQESIFRDQINVNAKRKLAGRYRWSVIVKNRTILTLGILVTVATLLSAGLSVWNTFFASEKSPQINATHSKNSPSIEK